MSVAKYSHTALINVLIIYSQSSVWMTMITETTQTLFLSELMRSLRQLSPENASLYTHLISLGVYASQT